MMMMRNNAATVNGFASPEPETAFTNGDCFNMRPKAVRSLSTISGRVSANHDDRPFGSTFTLRPRRSTEFVDRDPISDESRCDYLDLLDLGSLQQSKSEHELTSVAKGTLQAAQPLRGAQRPHFGSVECIHREDIRYLHS
ncbi:unnamed protein product [Anisakis simplex]|uniref:Uncharacterized protein n=1 Tax=Anisakis simplex TaxID=6269 RepID=A0A0M3K7H8_ANISI|nr:unnamed protein product [Anisakis simplex]